MAEHLTCPEDKGPGVTLRESANDRGLLKKEEFETSSHADIRSEVSRTSEKGVKGA